ncbi:phage virion morphogenesis protein [Chromobacterium sphagni]|uniref:Phage virion morphogenesis protein n=2 Tax=Chromobacterium sphagni TaxID=1903179 RepID=A0ABX3CDY1_9NEIS|nr:phage virion morphogenesis protein [Chromobacterium sphagni]
MNMMQLETELSGLLQRVEPAARRALARDIAKALRASQQQRIRDQLNPDGSEFAPRKPQFRAKKGKIRRQMFSKLRASKWLKVEATTNGAAVAFVGQVERIARVHQYGLRDRVSRRSRRETQYPARELLGFAAADIEVVRDQILTHLSN